MKISVAICTWNRARLLDQTLESLSLMEVPPGLDWELIVVDNNSSEPAVPIVLSGWKNNLPLVTAIEKQQGHSAARNRAVELATGDYIIWTDNDVKVAPNWLAAYANAFRQNPETAFFGGEIKPVFEQGKPEWIEKTWDICAPVYATRELGEDPVELGEGKLPYGANFALKTDIQRQHLYDTKWGRKTSAMVGEDEVAVLRAIVNSDGKGRWVPAAKLQHMIPADRASEKYVAAYYFGQGFTNALKGKVDRSRLSIRMDALMSHWSYRIRRLFSPPIVWVSKMVHSNICAGELAGLKHLASSAKATDD